MKKLFILPFILLSVFAFGQTKKTQAALTTQGSTIKNETVPAANTPNRIGSMFLDIVASMVNQNGDIGVESTGVANTYVATFTPCIAAYTDFYTIHVRFNKRNTGTATLNICGLGAKNIKKMDSTALNLSAGDLDSLAIYELVYNGTYFQLVGGLGTSGGGSGVWGAIGGDIADQTDLQTELGLKLNKGLTAGHIYVGNGSNIGISVAISGDATLSSAGSLSVVKILGNTVPANASGVLTNNGSGTLTWGSAGSSGTVTSIATNAPINGGTITTTGTIGIDDAVANGTTKGASTYTAADFNATAGVVSIDYTNGQTASGSTKGFVTAADWTTFNNKGSGTVTSIGTTGPITGGTITGAGTIAIDNAAADGSTKGAASFTAADFNSSSGNLSIDYTNGQSATSSVKGFLTSTDWTTFNNKGSGTVTSVSGTTNRITSTGGATPVLDVSATFEALLGKVASPLSQFASTSSAQLASTLSDETGTGVAVFSASPALTGNPTVPTQAAGDSSTRIATTAHVKNSYLNNDPTVYANHGALVGTTDKFWINQSGVNKYIIVNDLVRYAQSLAPVFVTTSDTLDTSYLLSNTHFNSASTINVSVPAGIFLPGDILTFTRAGAGTVTFVPLSGTTVHKASASYDMSDTWTLSAIYFISSTEFTIYQGINSGGDVITNGSVTNLHLAVYDGTTGNEIKDGGYSIANLLLRADSASAANINSAVGNKWISPNNLSGSTYVTQNSTKLYASTSGTNTYTATMSPALASYVTGQQFNIVFANGCTGSSTIDLGPGVKNLKKWSAGSKASLASGDISSGERKVIFYDGTDFQVGVSAAGSSATVTSHVNVGAAAVGTLPSTTIRYFGNRPQAALSSTADLNKIYFLRAGTITKAYIWLQCNTNTSATDITMSIRLNNTTDTTIATVNSTSTERYFWNGTLSISVGASTASPGDYVEIKLNSTGAQVAANCTPSGYIEVTYP